MYNENAGVRRGKVYRGVIKCCGTMYPSMGIPLKRLDYQPFEHGGFSGTDIALVFISYKCLLKR